MGNVYQEKFSNLVPISDLITYMIDQCDKIMEETKYHKQGLFYHDVLKQLCCKETIEWMKKRLLQPSGSRQY